MNPLAPASPLISATALASRLDASGPNTGPQSAPSLLDVRWQLGVDRRTLHAQYESGHLPGAVWVDLESELSGPVARDGTGGRHPMPATEDFQSAMRRAGVRHDRPVVVYDGSTSLGASRAWWLLRYFGRKDVQVLDGGLAAWDREGLPVESGVVDAVPGTFVATPGARQLLTAADVEHYRSDPQGHVVVDGRPADRFRGENESIDPVAGHIPGAVSTPALANLFGDGRFLPPDELADRFSAKGLRSDRTTALYCGSGVQATHLALALAAAGAGPVDPGVYIGSWSDWITEPERPVDAGRD